MDVGVQVQIPLTGDITTCHSGLAALFRFEKNCQQHHDCIIFVHTQQLRWIDANLCAILQATLYRLHHTHQLYFLFDRAELTNRLAILARNGFVSSQETQLTDNYGSTVPLQAFAPDADDAFIEYIEHKLLSHASLKLPPAVRSTMLSSFIEVFTNVDLHAATNEPLFTCGQYYHVKGQLCFSLVDLGVGYLAPVQRQLPHITKAAEAIVWAIGAGHTTRPLEAGYFDVPGGNGLTNLHTFCLAHGGELQIASGDAFWSNHQPNVCRSIEPFQGSIVNIIVPCPK